MIWSIFIVVTLIISILTFGVFNISSGMYIKSLCRARNNRYEIALTFDDGVDPTMTPLILDVLDKYGAKATFFIIGEKAERHPDLVREIAKRGHSIANHSFYHKWNFPLQSSDKIYSEIMRCNQILESILDRKITLFRPPFGVTNPPIATALKRSGLTSVGWSIRSFDTIGQPLERVEHRVAQQLSSGKVILLHDDRIIADILLEQIIKHITAMGLKCVTIDELFNLK